MKVKVSEATTVQLDWLVAYASDLRIIQIKKGVVYTPCYPKIGGAPFRPTTDWAQGGPIIDRAFIGVNPRADRALEENWSAQFYMGVKNDIYVNEYGPTPLIAAMRCFAVSKLGDEVPMASWYMCEECGGVFLSVTELGMCFNLDGDIREQVREMNYDGGLK